MLVTVTMNRFGHLEIDPVSDRQRRQLVKRMPCPPRGDEAMAYIQEDYNIEAFLLELSRSAARDIREGWETRVRISHDHADALFGAE